MKKKTFLRIIPIALCCCISIELFAQNNRTVKLVVSGEALTKEEATKQALRSAIEQAFGTFVSAHTEVLNDELIQDEIVTITTGNILEYKEINEIKNNNGSHYVTLETIVSIGNLTNFAKSKGVSAELATGTFAMNMKIRELNKKNEIQAISDLQAKLLKMHSDYNFFDYNLNVGEPYLKGDNYAIDVTIGIIPNINLANFRNTIASTLEALSLSIEEQEEYRRANIPFKTIKVQDFSSDEDFLRTIQTPFPYQRKADRTYKEIALRNVDNHYPSLYFPTLLLKNELQFALVDNIGREYFSFYTAQGLKKEVTIAHSFSPLWPVYGFKEKYRDAGTESYDFGFVGPQCLVTPKSALFYELSENFEFYIWDYLNKGFGDTAAKFIFEIDYPKEEFVKIEKIDIKYSKPLFFDE